MESFALKKKPPAGKKKLDRFKESLASYSSGKDIISDANFDLKSELSIEGKSSLILELKK